MNRVATSLPDVCIVEPVVHGDHRGFFLESYNARDFAAVGIDCTFVQDNHSRSSRGVVRGLHYQLARPQAKLVRVLAGEVYDVAVDIRRGSDTFGQWVGETLSAENKRMLFIPEGFAHGFCVVSEVAEFAYKCSDYYDPSEEYGVSWCDPDLGIPWPVGEGEAVLSERDQAFGPLANCPPEDLPVYAGGES